MAPRSIASKRASCGSASASFSSSLRYARCATARASQRRASPSDSGRALPRATSANSNPSGASSPCSVRTVSANRLHSVVASRAGASRKMSASSFRFIPRSACSHASVRASRPATGLSNSTSSSVRRPCVRILGGRQSSMRRASSSRRMRPALPPGTATTTRLMSEPYSLKSQSAARARRGPSHPRKTRRGSKSMPQRYEADERDREARTNERPSRRA